DRKRVQTHHSSLARWPYCACATQAWPVQKWTIRREKTSELIKTSKVSRGLAICFPRALAICCEDEFESLLQTRVNAMALESFAAMVETLRRLSLLEPARLEEISTWSSVTYSQPYSLSRELVRRGWLSVYQVNQLHQGNGRDLCIGRHRILDRLGEGGAGHVYKAWDTHLNCVVALKVVHEDLQS